MIELTESTFRERVLLKQAKSTPKIQEVNEDEEEIKYWVVMLYANWSVACLNFESVLAKLSVEYSAPHIKFAKIDVDIYSDLAEEYGVSKDPASFDLPTLVLFHQGKEIRRLPELTVTKEGQTTSKADAAKNTITRLGWNKKPVSFFLRLQKKINIFYSQQSRMHFFWKRLNVKRSINDYRFNLFLLY